MSPPLTHPAGSKTGRSLACRMSPSGSRSTCPDLRERRGIPVSISRAITCSFSLAIRATIRKCSQTPVWHRVASTTCIIRVLVRSREVYVYLSRKPIMTKSFGAAAVITLLALAPACTDLTEVPTSAITPENFYQNETQAVGGLASVYAQLKTSGATSNWYESSEISTDEMVVPVRGQNWYDNGQWLDIHRQTFTPTTTGTGGLINPAWNDLFTGIARANRAQCAEQRDVCEQGDGRRGAPNSPSVLLLHADGHVRRRANRHRRRDQGSRAEHSRLRLQLHCGRVERGAARPTSKVARRHEWPDDSGRGGCHPCQHVSERRGVHRHRICDRIDEGDGSLAGRNHRGG